MPMPEVAGRLMEWAKGHKVAAVALVGGAVGLGYLASKSIKAKTGEVVPTETTGDAAGEGGLGEELTPLLPEILPFEEFIPSGLILPIYETYDSTVPATYNPAGASFWDPIIGQQERFLSEPVQAFLQSEHVVPTTPAKTVGYTSTELKTATTPAGLSTSPTAEAIRQIIAQPSYPLAPAPPKPKQAPASQITIVPAAQYQAVKASYGG